MNKVCTKCKEPKLQSEYSNTQWTLKVSTCRDCVSLYNQEYRSKNAAKKLKADSEYRVKNRETINSSRRVENLTSDELKEHRSKTKIYRDKNKNRINEVRSKRKKERFAADSSYRIREAFGSHFRESLKLQGVEKKSSCFEILGYTFEELISCLESQFEPWMNWDNYGKYSTSTWSDSDQKTWTWQIDHIQPKANFTFTNDNHQEIKRCWALSNLRPYSAKQNNIDGGSKVRHKNRGKK